MKVRVWIVRLWMNGNRKSFQSSLLIMNLVTYVMPMRQVFLCKCEPDISLHFKGDQCHDDKRSKDSVTVLHGANMLEPLVVGKFKFPQCFKKC